MIPTGSGPFVDFLKVQEAVDELTNAPDDPKPLTVELRSQAGAIAAIGMGGHLFGSTVIVFVLSYFLLTFSDTLLKQAVESRDHFREKRNIV